MIYDLPKNLTIGGEPFEIRSDYRAALDICAALNDPELNDDDRGLVVLGIFYPGLESMSSQCYNEAIQRCFWFLGCGNDQQDKKAPRLMDWEQDFKHIVAPVNRVVGMEIRALDYMHWWTFISAYNEVGECLFSQIVGIRSKRAKGKALDKSEQAFYRQNRDIIDMKTGYTEAEDALFKQWEVK